MIFLGADHAGFQTKEKIKLWLEKKGASVTDCGNHHYDSLDDFPDFAVAVASLVAGTKHRGILFCGSGSGMVIAANKIRGAYAAVAWNLYTAKQAAKHDAVNILVIPARLISTKTAVKLISVWMNQKTSSEKKYRRRIRKIQKIEAGS